MKTLSTILVALLLFASGCSKTQHPATQQQSTGLVPSNTSAPEQAHPVGGVVPLETEYFRGSIGSAHGLHMKLVREGDNLTGSYFYQKVGTKIDLKGSIDKDGNVVLQEFDPTGAQTGVFRGMWGTDAEDGMITIAGNWTNPEGQKKSAFSLHQEPIYFSGGGDIAAKSIRENNKKLKYEIDVEYPQLSGLLTSGIEKFNQEASQLAQREVADFRKNMTEVSTREETAGDSELPDSSLGIGYTVILATDDLISIQFDVGTYFRGAAHPNSNSLVLNFDIRNGKVLKLADLFIPGAKYLQALSAFAIKDLKRQSKEKGPDGMLEDDTIESGAAPTSKNFESWTITKKGLGINFDSYQVAPYAAGPQYVLVPYSALRDLIEPNSPIAGLAK